jgi:hypothetical protein
MHNGQTYNSALMEFNLLSDWFGFTKAYRSYDLSRCQSMARGHAVLRNPHLLSIITHNVARRYRRYERLRFSCFDAQAFPDLSLSQCRRSTCRVDQSAGCEAPFDHCCLTVSVYIYIYIHCWHATILQGVKLVQNKSTIVRY